MLKYLLTTGEHEAKMIQALLEDNDIAVIVKDDEFGGYSKIYLGFSAYNVDLFVSEEQYQEAKELIDTLEVNTEQKNSSLDKEEDNSKKVISHYLALAAKILIILYLLFILFPLIIK